MKTAQTPAPMWFAISTKAIGHFPVCYLNTRKGHRQVRDGFPRIENRHRNLPVAFPGIEKSQPEVPGGFAGIQKGKRDLRDAFPSVRTGKRDLPDAFPSIRKTGQNVPVASVDAGKRGHPGRSAVAGRRWHCGQPRDAERAMPIRFRGKHGGPTARRHASPGQRPGSHPPGRQSPERAARMGPPFQGSAHLSSPTQGVALGWHVCAPLVLQASPMSRNRIRMERATGDVADELHGVPRLRTLAAFAHGGRSARDDGGFFPMPGGFSPSFPSCTWERRRGRSCTSASAGWCARLPARRHALHAN